MSEERTLWERYWYAWDWATFQAQRGRPGSFSLSESLEAMCPVWDDMLEPA